MGSEKPTPRTLEPLQHPQEPRRQHSASFHYPTGLSWTFGNTSTKKTFLWCRFLPSEEIQIKKVRFRTLGCYPLTGAVESEAETAGRHLARNH